MQTVGKIVFCPIQATEQHITPPVHRVQLGGGAVAEIHRPSQFATAFIPSLVMWGCVWSFPAVTRRPLEKVVEIDARRWRRRHGGPAGCEADHTTHKNDADPHDE